MNKVLNVSKSKDILTDVPIWMKVSNISLEFLNEYEIYGVEQPAPENLISQQRCVIWMI